MKNMRIISNLKEIQALRTLGVLILSQIVLSKVGNAATDERSNQNQGSAVEYLKSFTQHPAIVSNLIFQVEEYKPQRATKVFLGRLQPDAVFIREVENVEDLDSSSYFPGK